MKDKKRKPFDLDTLQAVASGEAWAIEKFVERYSYEINAIETLKKRAEEGSPNSEVDEEIRRKIVDRLRGELPLDIITAWMGEKHMESKENGLLDFETIQAAVAGEAWAVEKVVEQYAGDIDALASVEKRMPDGSTSMVVDEDIRQRLINKLIEELPKFDMSQSSDEENEE